MRQQVLDADGQLTGAGVAFVPVHGIPPGQVVLAWDTDRPPGHIAALLSAARGWVT